MDGKTPLSIDLRERAVAAVLKGGLSRHRAAAQFGVVPSTVINWVRRFQETGSVAPGQTGGHKPKAIAGEHHAFLVQRIRQREFTLRGLVAELAERGLKVDYRSVWNFVHAEKLSFKKTVRSPRYRTPASPVDGASEPNRTNLMGQKPYKASDSGPSVNLVRSIDFSDQFQMRGGGASTA